MYGTLWEECKKAQCPHRSWRERTKALMWYYSPTKNKLIYQVRAWWYLWFLAFWSIWKIHKQYILIPPSGPFSLKNDALPLNSLFWSPPAAVHRFHAWDMVVSGLYISCIWLSAFCLHANRPHNKWLYCYYMHDANLEYGYWTYFYLISYNNWNKFYFDDLWKGEGVTLEIQMVFSSTINCS